MIDNLLIEQCERELENKYKYFEEIALFNQEKVLNAFKNNQKLIKNNLNLVLT